MRFSDLSVRTKLWAVMVGMMVALLALAYGVQSYLGEVHSETARVVNFSEERITLVLRWKGMAELTAERVVVASISNDEELLKRMDGLIQNGIASNNQA